MEERGIRKGLMERAIKIYEETSLMVQINHESLEPSWQSKGVRQEVFYYCLWQTWIIK